MAPEAKKITGTRLLQALEARTSRMFQRPNRWLGRQVFGNTNSFALNIKGVWDQNRASAASGSISFPPTSIDAEEFKREGCVILPNPIPQKVMKPLRAEFERAIEDPNCYEVADKHLSKEGDLRRSIRNARRHMPSIAGVLTDDMRTAIEQYYNGYFDVLRIVAYRNMHVPSEISDKGIYANLWHCDARRPSLIKLMMNISDVTENDGPFEILSIQRTREMLRMGFRDRYTYGKSIDSINDPKHVISLVGEPGTAMLCNLDRCLHQAGVPAPGRHRDLLQFLFAPASQPLASNWMSHTDREIR